MAQLTLKSDDGASMSASSSVPRPSRSVFFPYGTTLTSSSGSRQHPGSTMSVHRGGDEPRFHPTFFVPQEGRYDYSVDTMCKAIDSSVSLQEAQITEVQCMKLWSHGILHRFVVMRISHARQEDSWLRIDRRAGQRVYRNLGRTVANDQARLAKSRDALFDPKELSSEVETHARFEPTQAVALQEPDGESFKGCPTLKQLGVYLRVMRAELSNYDVVRENCWFLASLILDFLLKLPLPNCKTTVDGPTRNNGIAPALRSRIKVRYIQEEGAESLTLNMDELVALAEQSSLSDSSNRFERQMTDRTQINRWNSPATPRKVSLSVVLGARIGDFFRTVSNHIFRPPADEFNLALVAAEHRGTIVNDHLREAFHESTLPALRRATELGSMKHRHTLALALIDYADTLFRDSQVEPLKEAVEHQMFLFREGQGDVRELADALRQYGRIETMCYNPQTAVPPLLESVELLRIALVAERSPFSLCITLFDNLLELGDAYTKNLQYEEAHKVFAVMLELGCQIYSAVPFAFREERFWQRSVYACVNCSRGEKVPNDIWGATVDGAASFSRCLILSGIWGDDSNLAEILELQGEAFALRKEIDSVTRVFAEAISIRRLAADADAGAWLELASSLRQYGEALHRVEQHQQAINESGEAMTILRSKVPSSQWQESQPEFALCFTLFAQIVELDNQWEPALLARQNVIELWKRCPWQEEKLSLALCAFAKTAKHQAKEQDALEKLEEAVGLLREMPWEVYRKDELREIFDVQADILESLGRTGEANAVKVEKAVAESGGSEYQDWLTERGLVEIATTSGISFDEHGIHITGMRLEME